MDEIRGHDKIKSTSTNINYDNLDYMHYNSDDTNDFDNIDDDDDVIPRIYGKTGSVFCSYIFVCLFV